MEFFSVYFELGFRHIVSLDALDHILFLLALVCVYQLSDFKRILLLITAFAIGHTISLILATTKLIEVSSNWIEFLIPVTIFATAMLNITMPRGIRSAKLGPYFFAIFFGLIHGIGFSNYLRMILSREADIAIPILAFNLGLELGQIAIVAAVMLLSLFAFSVLRVKQRDWILVISGICAGAALVQMKDTIFW